MRESIEAQKEQFRFPDIEAERGEFERVAQRYDVDCNTLMFLAKEEGMLQDLDAHTWAQLTNTDSNDLGQNDWDAVKASAEAHEVKRDWQKLKSSMARDEPCDAPIVVDIEGELHVVSGNTRLMVARALGITPKVLIFGYRHDRTNETV